MFVLKNWRQSKLPREIAMYFELMHENEKAKPHNGLRHDQRCFFKLSRCCPHVTRQPVLAR